MHPLFTKQRNPSRWAATALMNPSQTDVNGNTLEKLIKVMRCTLAFEQVRSSPSAKSDGISRSVLAKSRFTRSTSASAPRLDRRRSSLQCECYEVPDGRVLRRPARETRTIRLGARGLRAPDAALRAPPTALRAPPTAPRAPTGASQTHALGLGAAQRVRRPAAVTAADHRREIPDWAGAPRVVALRTPASACGSCRSPALAAAGCARATNCTCRRFP